MASIAYLALFVLPGLDHRFGWSVVPHFISIIGDFIVVTGLFIVFLVFKVNTFTSATIEVAEKQTVIASGPYAIVRHPMYIGALIMIFGVPLALGSLWGLLMLIPFILIISQRLLNEEIFLTNNLEGYNKYKSKVKYRLLPFIW